MKQSGFGWLHLILIAVAIGLVTIAIGMIYQKGYAAGEAKVKLAWEQANRDQREAEMNQAGKAASGLEDKRAKREVVTRTITQYVDRLVDRPVYRNVCLDADGVCLVNAAISGKSPDSCKPDLGLPPAGTPAGRSGGLRLKVDYGDSGALSGLRG